MYAYDNIGGKIKNMAVWVFRIEAIAAVITGIALMGTDKDLILYGLLFLLVGPIIAWVSSWLLYGFGQLIENSDIIAEEYNRKKQIKANMENPNFDEDKYIDITCPNCKAELSFTKGHLQSGAELTCPMCDSTFSV